MCPHTHPSCYTCVLIHITAYYARRSILILLPNPLDIHTYPATSSVPHRSSSNYIRKRVRIHTSSSSSYTFSVRILLPNPPFLFIFPFFSSFFFPFFGPGNCKSVPHLATCVCTAVRVTKKRGGCLSGGALVLLVHKKKSSYH
jgi:hypothetical protein